MSVIWTPDQVRMLEAEYATASLPDLVEKIGKSLDAIYCKARHMKLKRPHPSKQPGWRSAGCFKPGHVPKNKGKGKPRSRLTVRVLDYLMSGPDGSATAIAEAIGARRTSVWRVCYALCQDKKIHINRWVQTSGANSMAVNWIAVYRAGPGENAIRPVAVKPEQEDPYRILPIPQPVLGFWHERVFSPQQVSA